jgi:hypothetical protein
VAHNEPLAARTRTHSILARVCGPARASESVIAIEIESVFENANANANENESESENAYVENANENANESVENESGHAARPTARHDRGGDSAPAAAAGCSKRSGRCVRGRGPGWAEAERAYRQPWSSLRLHLSFQQYHWR